MVWLLRRNFKTEFRKRYLFFLAFIWLLGLLSGVGFSSLAGHSFFSLMRGAAFRPVSIVSLLSVSLLPFLFSAVTVYIRSFGLLAVLCFIKGCLFAFVSMGIFAAFESAGWLLRILMMFSNLFCLLPLWWCWIRILSGAPKGSFSPVVGGGLMAAGIVCYDYLYVLPFLAKLVEY